MKLDVVGSCCTWTKQLSTSFILNDEILIDAPQGSFKTLSHKYDLEKIKYIIITHFHSDHFIDLHLVLDYIFSKFPDHTLSIVAPKGCEEKLCSLFRLVEVGYLEAPLKQRVKFIDFENGKKFKLDNYSFKAYLMSHVGLDAYGFMAEQNGIKVGFSGDTSMCNNVRKIIKKSNACFIDCASVNQNNKHLSCQEVLDLQEEFSDCKLYPVHLSDHSKAELDRLKVKYPKQGEIITIK